MLPQKGVTVFDKENNTVREVRYCPNEPSIYVDEQSDNAIKESVILGRVGFSSPKQTNLKAFLDEHPFNVENGGHIFKLVDKKRDAEVELMKEFKASEAVGMVRDKDINELLPIALYFKVNINTPTSEIRYNLLNIAKKKPQEFIESFDSPQVQARSVIQQAKDYQIIGLKEDRCFWFDSKTMIVSVPAGQNPMDVMVRYCLTEEGASVLAELEQQLEACVTDGRPSGRLFCFSYICLMISVIDVYTTLVNYCNKDQKGFVTPLSLTRLRLWLRRRSTILSFQPLLRPRGFA